jgi:hypothetical protein
MIRALYIAAFGWCVLLSTVSADEPDARPAAPARLISVEVAWAEFDPSLLAVNLEEPAGGAKLLETLRAAAEAQDKVASFTQVRLSALENMPASAHWGERVNVMTARSPSATLEALRGGSAAAFQQQNLGTIVAATNRVDEAGQIVIELSIEQSKIAADDASDAAGSSKTVTRTF